jgi:hypothetical protein
VVNIRISCTYASRCIKYILSCLRMTLSIGLKVAMVRGSELLRSPGIVVWPSNEIQSVIGLMQLSAKRFSGSFCPTSLWLRVVTSACWLMSQLAFLDGRLSGRLIRLYLTAFLLCLFRLPRDTLRVDFGSSPTAPSSSYQL